MPRSPISPLITTTSPVSRYHSLSLWIITRKCPLRSFNPWLRAPSVVMVFHGRRGDVWRWAVACCIRSSRLMYLVWPVPTVCRLEMSILMKVLGASCWKPGPVPSSLCSARFHQKVHPSLVWAILTMILLIQHTTIIAVITHSDRVI